MLLLFFYGSCFLLGFLNKRKLKREGLSRPHTSVTPLPKFTETVILPLNIDDLWEFGAEKDTTMVNINRSHQFLEFKGYTNGHFRVCICDPERDTKRVINPSASREVCSRIIDRAFMGEVQL